LINKISGGHAPATDYLVAEWILISAQEREEREREREREKERENSMPDNCGSERANMKRTPEGANGA